MLTEDRPRTRCWDVRGSSGSWIVWAQHRDITPSGAVLFYNCLDPQDRRTYTYVLDVAPGQWTTVRETDRPRDVGLGTETVGTPPQAFKRLERTN